VFTDPQVTVTGNNIYLSYGYAETEMACPDVYMPYSAVFQIPALEEGSYNVYLQPDQNCIYQTFPCTDHFQDLPVDVLLSSARPIAIDYQKPGIYNGTTIVQGRALVMNMPGYAGPLEAVMYSVSGQPVYTWKGSILNKQTIFLPGDIGSGIFFLKISGSEIPGQLVRIIIP
jgi:hypothetical protein